MPREYSHLVGSAAVPGSVEVRPVQGRRELNRFIKLPFRLHRGTPWVPPLIYERRQFLNKEKNPYFEHAEAEYFLAWRDGEPVGPDHRPGRPPLGSSSRAAATGSSASSRPRTTRRSSRPCSATAEDWVRERGRERLVGPMDFTTNDECGLLIEGYERAPDASSSRGIRPTTGSGSRRSATARPWTS